MEGQIRPHERRKYRRFPLDFPVDGHREKGGKAIVGKAVNASEGGLMVCFTESMSVGARLFVSMLFDLGFELTEIRAQCQVVWKDVGLISDFPGYQYGLKFLEIGEYDISKLKRLRKSMVDHTA
jgi:c-di-GMP-binding flagellar brake protein YcgR